MIHIPKGLLFAMSDKEDIEEQEALDSQKMIFTENDIKNAYQEEVLKAKREALKKKLLEGDKITFKNSETIADDKDNTNSVITLPKGGLA